MPSERSTAFAPGRVNLIGEHTDYNDGLALPFAIAEGVTVTADGAPAGSPEQRRIRAHACELDERDEFPLAHPQPASGWRAFVRGVVAELARAGRPPVGASVEISGGPTRGAGLSSSAALEVALCLALDDLAARSVGDPRRLPKIDVARLCTRVENDWVGAHTGLLDQLASLYGEPDAALLIDFRSLQVEPVQLLLGDWRLVVLDSGERHLHASSGYNRRRAECARACQLLGVPSLRDADADALEQLPEPLRRRVLHVISENQRVRVAVAALQADDLPALASLLNASHESLRDNYDVSTPAVEATRERLLDAGARGARLIGGGFGGSVLGLLQPGVSPPAGARTVRPGPGAHLVE
ncbi:MAG TPA: galactokinase family protein [Solirubrobacteraceae bacterium]|nr:galactokinase family protein [Solirubrobacteraceae bacterium]